MYIYLSFTDLLGQDFFFLYIRPKCFFLNLDIACKHGEIDHIGNESAKEKHFGQM